MVTTPQVAGATQCPLPSQDWPPAQLPQLPPQPSAPQVLPVQLGVQGTQ